MTARGTSMRFADASYALISIWVGARTAHARAAGGLTLCLCVCVAHTQLSLSGRVDRRNPDGVGDPADRR